MSIDEITDAFALSTTISRCSSSTETRAPSDAERGSRGDTIPTAQYELQDIHEDPPSPITSIFPEILGLIFLHLDERDKFTVCRVCRFWREVALATPTLWTNIKLHLEPGPTNDADPKFRMAVATLPLKLERSRGALLDINVVVAELSHASHPAFQAILDCSDRWERAKIYIQGVTLPMLDRIRGRIPALHTLAIYILGPITHQGQVSNVFQEAPSLRHISFWGQAGLSLLLPWSQLESYEEISGGNVSTEARISQFTSISILSLTVDFFIPVNPIICTNLEILEVRFKSQEHLELFSKIQAPRIWKIEISSTSAHDDVTPHLLIMLRNMRTPCFLRQLTLANNNFDHPGALTAVLELTPALEVLTTLLPPEEDLRSLIFKPEENPTPLVPKLRRLVFTVDQDREYEHILTDIGLSRCELASPSCSECPKAVTPLASFELKLRSNIRSSIIRQSLRRQHRHLKVLEPFMNDSEAPEELSRWEATLRNAFMSQTALENGRKMLNKIFSSLMSSPINTHHIYQTGIHVTLKYFVDWNLGTRSCEGPEIPNSELRSRAQDILKRWETSMLLDIPNRHWRLADGCALFYVPRHDVLRSMDPLGIVYGPAATYAFNPQEPLRAVEGLKRLPLMFEDY